MPMPRNNDQHAADGVLGVRNRPGLYVGSTGKRGLQRMIEMVVARSVGEATAGHATRIDVRLFHDQRGFGVEVADDGRGVPVELSDIPSDKRLASMLPTPPEHGIVLSMVNALSARFETVSRGSAFTWLQTYEHAIQESNQLGEKWGKVRRETRSSAQTGTTIRFWADPKVFDDIDYDFDTLADRLQEIASLNKDLVITLTDDRQTHEGGNDEAAANANQLPSSTEEDAEKLRFRSFRRSDEPLDPEATAHELRLADGRRVVVESIDIRASTTGTDYIPSVYPDLAWDLVIIGYEINSTALMIPPVSTNTDRTALPRWCVRTTLTSDRIPEIKGAHSKVVLAFFCDDLASHPIMTLIGEHLANIDEKDWRIAASRLAGRSSADSRGAF